MNKFWLLVSLIACTFFLIYFFTTRSGKISYTPEKENNPNLSILDVITQVSKVDLSAKDFKVSVELTIKNKKNESFQLDPIISGPLADNNFFEIRNAKGEKISYLGKMKRRVAPEDSEFMLIDPGKTYSTTFELSKDEYDFKGKGIHWIRMNVTNHFSRDRIILVSDWVKFKI